VTSSAGSVSVYLMWNPPSGRTVVCTPGARRARTAPRSRGRTPCALPWAPPAVVVVMQGEGAPTAGARRAAAFARSERSGNSQAQSFRALRPRFQRGCRLASCCRSGLACTSSAAHPRLLGGGGARAERARPGAESRSAEGNRVLRRLAAGAQAAPCIDPCSHEELQ